ncbi:MAG: PhzF family phenazine biosynthesis protein [Crocinitomicaceae bacterium]
MPIEIFQIDAFTDQLFAGNPAAVCPLNNWLDDDILQNIAAENNLAETGFFIEQPNGQFHLRWFTPEFEMDLCGHGTLAAAYVIFEELDYSGNEITFNSLSGLLTVKKEEDMFVLNFPSRPPVKSELPKLIKEGLDIQPKEVWKARDYLLLYENEDDIRKIKPNIILLNQINIDPGGIIVTAKGSTLDADFVSRLFTPQASVFEDPVTGSAHCTLIPFWSEKLKKNKFKAFQLSKRGGELHCELQNNRVLIKGKAVKYLKGIIEI